MEAHCWATAPGSRLCEQLREFAAKVLGNAVEQRLALDEVICVAGLADHAHALVRQHGPVGATVVLARFARHQSFRLKAC
ncbi:hypothetical protein GCM10025876_09920 [Demequina litorisediminis]|uniref:Transposase IS200 like protein n=1 Tax=Demequina litorisediminis TaxID=1849022 RepID=A0ABQ6IDH3_9MICO|nr:hypothetical protein GCM10025876_09920 [Demequina litorisediminis]